MATVIVVLTALLATCACSADVGGSVGSDAIPPHHRDGGYTNPGYGAHRAPSIAVTLPFFARRVAGTFAPPTDLVPSRVANDGSFLRENALHSSPTVTWVGHSTLLVQMGGVTFLTDPIWSRYASPVSLGPKRLVEPGVRFEDLPAIDFVLVSHNHYDHMDVPTLKMLAEHGVPIFVPLDNGDTLEDNAITTAVELDWWQSRTMGEVTVHCVPARHWSRRGLFDMNESLWSGWVVSSAERRFYFAGDTGMFDGFSEIGERLGPFDLAAVPIGAYLPEAMMAPAHLNPEEAVEAAVMLGAKRSLAIHFGTFVLSDEPFDEPPRRFSDASRQAARGADVDWLLAIGETRLW